MQFLKFLFKANAAKKGIYYMEDFNDFTKNNLTGFASSGDLPEDQMNKIEELPVVQIAGLCKTYNTGSETLTILNDLDLTLFAGTKAVICGESGCGKSTLLNIIGSLDTPTGGYINCCGYQIDRLNEDQLAQYRSHDLGLIFQFHYLLKDFSALENVFMPAYIAGMSKKEAKMRAKQLLCDVGLEKRMNHLPSQLSGGERQRVAVARALINDPKLILADEATGNLDPANALLVGEMFFNLVDRYKKTLVLVTHDMNLAKAGDVIYKLVGGKLQSL